MFDVMQCYSVAVLTLNSFLFGSSGSFIFNNHGFLNGSTLNCNTVAPHFMTQNGFVKQK
jgi:hypothetical protein